MGHSDGFTHVLNAAGGYTQVNVVVDGVVEVGQLDAVTAIVEDQVLIQARVSLAHIEVDVLGTSDSLLARGSHTRPIAIEVVHVTPHVQGDVVPTGLIEHIDHIAVMLNRRAVAAPVVTLPALTPHIGEGAQTGIVSMVGHFTLDGELGTLGSAVETETVGKRLASLKSGGIQIDAPLDVATRSLHEFPLLLAHRCTVAVKGAHDVDFLVNCSAVGSDKLQQDAVGAGLELLALVVKDDVLVAGATGHHSQGSHQHHQQAIYISCFHILILLIW